MSPSLPVDAPTPKRIAVLYTRLSGYVAACLRTLRERHGTDLLVVRWPVASEAPFQKAAFEGIGDVRTRDEVDDAALADLLNDFDPQGVLMSGWADKGYLRVAGRLRRRSVPVIGLTDAQWRGSLRQRVASATAARALHPYIDVLWGAGERQRDFAARLGYSGRRYWDGCYAADLSRFAGDPGESEREPTPTFLFVGRLVEVKGIDVLVAAYSLYRSRVIARGGAPWDLTCVGTGPLSSALDGVEGVQLRGFVQPDGLPRVLHEASAFVLPSRWEPWGVALQEGAAAGLPLIASDACGAAVHLLRDRYNGYTFGSGDVEHLASALSQVAACSEQERERMGARSAELAKQYTPERWADTAAYGIGALMQRGGGGR